MFRLSQLGVALLLTLALVPPASSLGSGLDDHKHGGNHGYRAAAPPAGPPVSAPMAALPLKGTSAMAAAPALPACHTGPRGGTYTITASGRKNYNG